MDVQIFNSSDFGSVRCMSRDGIPWFVAKDVCGALGLRTNNLRAVLDVEEVALIPNDYTVGISGKTPLIISESGLYSLILRSRKPEARAFKKWVTSEVIPAIRKHGGYLTPSKVEETLLNPDTIIQLATQLKEERAKRIAIEAQRDVDAPKVLFADCVASSANSIPVGDMAKLLLQNGINIGRTRLFSWLRENGYLMHSNESWNVPTQYAMKNGWFEVKEYIVDTGAIPIVQLTTRVTGKGQIQIDTKFLGS